MGKEVPPSGLSVEAAVKPAEYGQLPVADMDMKGCLAFCRKLTAKVQRDVRLPSEAEWEYACRAGTKTVFYFGDDWQVQTSANKYRTLIGEYAWQSESKKPQHVGLLKPNAWGLYDMYGNVAERTLDPHHPNYEGRRRTGASGRKEATRQ